jgi:hypothetical protein
VVLEIIAEIKALIPALKDAEFTSFGFTPAMRDMAKARTEACAKANPKAFEEGETKRIAAQTEMLALLKPG